MQKRLRTKFEDLLDLSEEQRPPYINLDDLKAFKALHKPQGFCCRFRSCPAFHNGFVSTKARTNHETEHFPTYTCKECDFSVRGFRSKGDLLRHANKYHPKIENIELPVELFPYSSQGFPSQQINKLPPNSHKTMSAISETTATEPEPDKDEVKNQAMDQNISAQQRGIQENANFVQGQQHKSLPPWKPSKEDNEAINKLAAQMAEATPVADIAKIRANLDGMTAQQREIMRQKGVEPLVYFFRIQAAKEYRRNRLSEMAASSNVDHAKSNQNDSSQGLGQRQAPVGIQGNRPLSATGQEETTPFLDNLDPFQAHQAEGFRSHETGQLLVPSGANAHGVNIEQFRTQQGIQKAQQHTRNTEQAALDRIKRAARFQSRPLVETQAQAATGAQSAQNQPSLQCMPQTNSPMFTLYKGGDPSISGGSSQGTPRPPSAAPLSGPQVQGQQQQPGAQIQPNSLQSVNQASRPSFAQLPLQLQHLLRSRPKSEWKQIMQEYQRSPAVMGNIQAPNMQ